MSQKLQEKMQNKLLSEFEDLFVGELFKWKSKDIKDIDNTFDNLRTGTKKILFEKH